MIESVILIAIGIVGIVILFRLYSHELELRVKAETRLARRKKDLREARDQIDLLELAKLSQGRVRVAGAPFDGVISLESSGVESVYFEIHGRDGEYARTPDVPLELLSSDDHETLLVGWSP